MRTKTGITNKAMGEMNAAMDMLREEVELTQRAIVDGFRGLERKMEKWNRRLDRLEGSITSLEASPRGMTKSQKPKVGCAVVESEINFTKLPPEYLKAWLAGKRVLLIEFALDLEREIYEDNPSELMLDVEDRTSSTEKTNFIQKAIFKYFTIPKKSEESVWEMVKSTLNTRARASRNRTSAEPI